MVLTSTCNYSGLHNTFPPLWKLAHIIPIFKLNKPLKDTSTYASMFSQSIISKESEKLIRLNINIDLKILKHLTSFSDLIIQEMAYLNTFYQDPTRVPFTSQCRRYTRHQQSTRHSDQAYFFRQNPRCLILNQWKKKFLANFLSDTTVKVIRDKNHQIHADCST